MTRTVIATSILALGVLLPSLRSAATHPDYSGTWEMDSARSDSPHSAAATGPVTLVIKQSDSEVSIETKQGGKSETLVYKLDGSESEKPAQDNGPYRWRAMWEGAKLSTETHRNINRSTVTVKEVRSLENKGAEMIVERTLVVQHGYTMRGAQNYSSGKDVFVKARKQ